VIGQFLAFYATVTPIPMLLLLLLLLPPTHCLRFESWSQRSILIAASSRFCTAAPFPKTCRSQETTRDTFRYYR